MFSTIRLNLDISLSITHPLSCSSTLPQGWCCRRLPAVGEEQDADFRCEGCNKYLYSNSLYVIVQLTHTGMYANSKMMVPPLVLLPARWKKNPGEEQALLLVSYRQFFCLICYISGDHNQVL
jgi:hypothetical protein